METLAKLAYLVAAALFIVGLKRLSSPSTAPGGNRLAAWGMLVAVVTVLISTKLASPAVLVAGLVVGSAIGWWLARSVQMTGMPELVAALNGFGGAASALVAWAEVVIFPNSAPEIRALAGLTMAVGTLTFSGSFVAFGKLSGKISGNPVTFPGIRIVTALGALAALAGVGMLWNAAPLWLLVALVGVAFILGILTTIPIGGADMPVVVSLLNAYSGIAAGLAGLVLSNTALIVSGALVGASGLILTRIMCDAMNRSLLNVLAGGLGGNSDEASTTSATGGTITETTADDVAIGLVYAQRVVVVPGYGMAVAQAQHQVRELADLLIAKGVQVTYAIHPVAGRMPGHMNVLLAEANVPYDQLIEMDEANAAFPQTDLVLVVGSNDVVNPAARTDTASPIYGMPILEVDKARQVVVLKRSMRPGYSGVENALFYAPNTRMLFGDAKAMLQKLAVEVKAL